MALVKSNQFIERAIANTRSFSSLFFRLWLLVCILAIASLISLVYPVLIEKNVQKIRTPRLGHFLINGSQDSINLDYDLWDSENKLAGLDEKLLAYATIDPNEKQEKQTIRMLLEGTGKNVLVNLRNKWRYHRGRNAVVRNWIFQIQSPKYDVYWPRFRQLLEAWSRKKRLEPLVIGELLTNMKTTLDDFYNVEGNPHFPSRNGESERYKTCAVVGNSGILLSNTFGSRIDNHDVVIRLNNAKVRGFEEYVGSKTIVSFVNSNVYHQDCSLKRNCLCLPSGSIPIVLYLCQVQHLMDIAFCERHYDSPVIVTDPRFDALCTRLVKWYSFKNYVNVSGNPIRSWAENHSAVEFHYSSGLQAIVLALGICEKVDIFGFGKAPNGRHHYRYASVLLNCLVSFSHQASFGYVDHTALRTLMIAQRGLWLKVSCLNISSKARLDSHLWQFSAAGMIKKPSSASMTMQRRTVSTTTWRSTEPCPFRF